MERRAAIAAAGNRGERGALDLQSYLQNESSLQQQKRRQAEQMLALGNSALQNGDPQQARRAFESAYGLSRNDAAFNEDARVQLNNLKLQQALVGLNVRQAAVGGTAERTARLNGTLNNVRNNSSANYSQQDAKQIIDNNSADENAALMKLAGRLIQQQDAAVANPAVIRANIPEQGRLLTFKRAVVVDTLGGFEHWSANTHCGRRVVERAFAGADVDAAGVCRRPLACAQRGESMTGLIRFR